MTLQSPRDTSSPSEQRTRRDFLRQAATLGAGLTATPLLTHASPVVASPDVQSRCFTTRDGVRLNYLEAGRGEPLVLIPGWSQTAAMFAPQIAAFSRRYRVIAVDLRGHGDSEKPAGGYRVARLARDLREFLKGLELRGCTVAAHSMGCSVLWSYWEHFGRGPIRRLVLIDQAPAVTAWPGWTQDERELAGTLFTPQTLYDTAAALSGPDGVAVTEGLVGGLFSSSFPREQLAPILQQNLKFPRPLAARLLVDHCSQDWRDVIPTIDVPTLVVGGRISIFHPRSQEWIASRIRRAQLSLFEAAEGGSHFMFLENPEKFNRVVLDFLG